MSHYVFQLVLIIFVHSNHTPFFLQFAFFADTRLFFAQFPVVSLPCHLAIYITSVTCPIFPQTEKLLLVGKFGKNRDIRDVRHQYRLRPFVTNWYSVLYIEWHTNIKLFPYMENLFSVFRIYSTIYYNIDIYFHFFTFFQFMYQHRNAF